MFKYNKIPLAIAISLVSYIGVATADVSLVVDGAGIPILDGAGDTTDTVGVLNPKFRVPYNASMQGVIFDLVEGVEASGDPVADNDLIAACADSAEFAYVPYTEMNCSNLGCDWIPTTTLKNGSSYYLNNVTVTDGAVDVTTRDNCESDFTNPASNQGVTFMVDTATGPVEPPAVAPPETVVITTATECTDPSVITNLPNDCVIEFTHANAPAASEYQVWINDSNGIRLDPIALSGQADDTTDYVDGWFQISTGGISVPNRAVVTCSPKLDGSRSCQLIIANTNNAAGVIDHPEMGNLAAGPFKVWIKAWNSAGYSAWSAPEGKELTAKDHN